MQNIALVAVIGIAAASLVIALILSRVIYICPPNAVLIFSGGHRRLVDASGEARQIGYRVVQGGRGIRIPLIEVVDRMDLTNMIIELKVAGAYSRGGIPLIEAGKLIGAIGCSGGTGSQDEVACKAGAASVK